MEGRPGFLRVAGYLAGLLAVFALLLVLVQLATGVPLLPVTVGTWRVSLALPAAIVAAVANKAFNDAANRREARG